MALPLRILSLGLLNSAGTSGTLSCLVLASMELALMAFQQRCVTTIRDLPCDGSPGLPRNVRD